MNIFRKMLIEKLERNGGYYGGFRSDQWPLEFNVALYNANLDFDNILKLAKEEFATPKISTARLARIEDGWDPNRVWESVQEAMARGVCDGDDDAWRSYSPATAAKYGLPYMRFPRRFSRISEADRCYYPVEFKGQRVPGWKREDPYEAIFFDVEFSLAGRCGKHLVVDEFEGIPLRGLSAKGLIEELEKEPRGAHDTPSNMWCRHLCAMIEEWEVQFTPDVASREMEYQAAHRLSSEICDAHAEFESAVEARKKRQHQWRVDNRFRHAMECGL